MPRVDNHLDRLGCARYMTTLDLCKGYWQVLPFGLEGAPATFQRLMEGVWDYAGPYLDDVVVFNKTWEDHLIHVQDILQRIKDAGLTINPFKCAFAQSQVEYLGFVIGSGSVRPQVGKLHVPQGVQVLQVGIRHIAPLPAGEDLHGGDGPSGLAVAPNNRIIGLYLSLQAYNFNVKYRLGKQNVIADYLSQFSRTKTFEGGWVM